MKKYRVKLVTLPVQEVQDDFFCGVIVDCNTKCNSKVLTKSGTLKKSIKTSVKNFGILKNFPRRWFEKHIKE
jgi:hypothetical protein